MFLAQSDGEGYLDSLFIVWLNKSDKNDSLIDFLIDLMELAISRACRVYFKTTDIDRKLQILEELLIALDQSSNEPCIKEVLKIIESELPCEIFSEFYWNSVCIEPYYSKNWKYKQYIYKIVEKLVVNVSKINKMICILVRNLTGLDCRERLISRNIILKIYQLNEDTKKGIRNTIKHNLSSGFCSKELLEVVLFIISLEKLEGSGQFYTYYIIVLHSKANLALFHDTLVRIVFHFLSYQETLIEFTVKYLINHFPTTNTEKKTYYLRELADLSTSFYANISHPLLYRVASIFASCIVENHIKVSHEAFLLLSNIDVKSCFIISQDCSQILHWATIDAIKAGWNDKIIDEGKEYLAKTKSQRYKRPNKNPYSVWKQLKKYDKL